MVEWVVFLLGGNGLAVYLAHLGWVQMVTNLKAEISIFVVVLICAAKHNVISDFCLIYDVFYS